jgi:hypothetical protein
MNNNRFNLYAYLCLFFIVTSGQTNYAMYDAGADYKRVHESHTLFFDFGRTQAPASFSISLSQPAAYNYRQTYKDIYTSREIHQAKQQYRAACRELNQPFLNTLYFKHIARAALAPAFQLQASTQDLLVRLQHAEHHLQIEFKIRSALLKHMNLSEPVKKFTQQQKESIPPYLQYRYWENAAHIQEFQFKRNLITKQLEFNKAIMQPVTEEFQRAEASFKAWQPNKEPYHLLEAELVKLPQQIDQSKQDISTAQKAIALHQIKREKLQAKIIELDHWYKFFSGDKLAAKRENLISVDGKISTEQSKIVAAYNTIENCQREIDRIQPIVEHGRQCAADDKILREMYAKLTAESSQQQLDSDLKRTFAEVATQQNQIELNTFGEEWVRLHGEDPAALKSFYGNKFHKNLLNHLCGSANRLGKSYADHKHLFLPQSHLEQATAQVIVYAADRVHKGTPSEALAWTKLAHAFEETVNVVAAVGRGAITGVKNSIQGTINLVTHPMLIKEQLKDFGRLVMQAYQSDRKLEILQDACKQFSELPLAIQVEHGTALMVSFMVPSIAKFRPIERLKKVCESIRKVMQFESTALNALAKIESTKTVVIKTIAVPEKWAAPIQDLINAGTITSPEQVQKAVHFLEAPVTTSWIDAVKDIAKKTSPQSGIQKTEQLAAASLVQAGQIERKAEQATQAVQQTASVETKIASAAQHVAQDVNTTNSVKWGHWIDLSAKIEINGKEYAKIGDKLYTRHAIERMVPKGYGSSFVMGVEGRGVPISVVEDVIANGSITERRVVEGAERVTKTIGQVGVVLENNDTVITVLIKSGK